MFDNEYAGHIFIYTSINPLCHRNFAPGNEALLFYGDFIDCVLSCERYQSCRISLLSLFGLLPVFSLFVKIYLFLFPFDVWDTLWILIRLVPEESLLIFF